MLHASFAWSQLSGKNENAGKNNAIALGGGRLTVVSPPSRNNYHVVFPVVEPHLVVPPHELHRRRIRDRAVQFGPGLLGDPIVQTEEGGAVLLTAPLFEKKEQTLR